VGIAPTENISLITTHKGRKPMRFRLFLLAAVVVLGAGLFLSPSQGFAGTLTTSDALSLEDGAYNIYTNFEPDTLSVHLFPDTPVNLAYLGRPTILIESPSTTVEELYQNPNSPLISDAFGIIPASRTWTDPISGAPYGVYANTFAYMTDGDASLTLAQVQSVFNFDPSNATYVHETTEGAGFSVNNYLGTDPFGQWTGTFWSDLDSVPEPCGAIALCGLAGMGLLGLVWRRRRA
jgi:hypothetical protein